MTEISEFRTTCCARTPNRIVCGSFEGDLCSINIRGTFVCVIFSLSLACLIFLPPRRNREGMESPREESAGRRTYSVGTSEHRRGHETKDLECPYERTDQISFFGTVLFCSVLFVCSREFPDTKGDHTAQANDGIKKVNGLTIHNSFLIARGVGKDGRHLVQLRVLL